MRGAEMCSLLMLPLHVRRRRREQVVASGAMQHHDLRYWQVSAAPAPKDLIWKNLMCASPPFPFSPPPPPSPPSLMGAFVRSPNINWSEGILSMHEDNRG